MDVADADVSAADEVAVDGMVESGVMEMGSADEIAVAVAVAEAEMAVVSASVGVMSLKATAIVEPVSASSRSVCELPVRVWAETVAPNPSMNWTTE